MSTLQKMQAALAAKREAYNTTVTKSSNDSEYITLSTVSFKDYMIANKVTPLLKIKLSKGSDETGGVQWPYINLAPAFEGGNGQSLFFGKSLIESLKAKMGELEAGMVLSTDLFAELDVIQYCTDENDTDTFRVKLVTKGDGNTADDDYNKALIALMSAE
jgi:hypothetical protein